MSVSYAAVGWNPHKKMYVLVLLSFIGFYLALFIACTFIFFPEVTAETAIIRSTSTLAFLLLHVILSIGPLARLNTVFLPLLYNRRHLGVTMFTVALIHGAFSIFQFHALGNINPLVSVFVSNRHYYSLLNFPFQSLGFIALVILLLMAATSHDFWLNNLSPKVWKSLHMMVYVAYALIVFHVMLGVIQLEQSPYLTGLLFSGVTIIALLHLAAAFKERRLDQKNLGKTTSEFVFVCGVEEIIEKRARVFRIGKERVAVFKYDGKISAVSNVCKHQNGPLGEGKIIEGCITCPWHGYQYLPHNGRAPEPFHEKVTTYRVMVIENKVYVDPQALAEGTEVMPAQINN